MSGKKRNCNIKKIQSYNFCVYIVIIIVIYLCSFITISVAGEFENSKMEGYKNKENIAFLSPGEDKKIQNTYTIDQTNYLATKSFSVVGKGRVLKKKENECIDVVVPTAYHVAFNPYGLEVQMGNGDISREQVLSKNYGIINKSSKDVIVRVVFIIEDLNEGKIKFVDSYETAKNAESDIFAICLAMLPSDGSTIMIGDEKVNLKTTGKELSDVNMKVSRNTSKILYGGENLVEFRLPSAVYEMQDIDDISYEESLQVSESANLKSCEMGITAFTFGGSMNENADWNKLSKGVKITSIYTYEAIDSHGDKVGDIGTVLNNNNLNVVLGKE